MRDNYQVICHMCTVGKAGVGAPGYYGLVMMDEHYDHCHCRDENIELREQKLQ